MSTLTNQIARVDTELINYNALPEKLELYSEVINLNVMKVYINSEEFTLTLKSSTNFENEITELKKALALLLPLPRVYRNNKKTVVLVKKMSVTGKLLDGLVIDCPTESYDVGQDIKDVALDTYAVYDIV